MLGITDEELEWMTAEPFTSISIKVPLGPPPDIRYRTIGLKTTEFRKLVEEAEANESR